MKVLGPTDDEVNALANAMCMVLNDLAHGDVCDLVKAEARVAFEPFLLDDNGDLPDFEWAQNLIAELTGKRASASLGGTKDAG